MLSRVELYRFVLSPRILVVALAFGAAGCSSDTSRFNENPFSSGTGQPEATGSLPQSRPSVAAAAPVGRVESRPMPQMQGSALPPPSSSYPSQSSYPSPRHTAEAALPSRAPAANWQMKGGNTIVVKHGETLSSLSRQHHVPASAILQANHLSTPSIRVGQRLVIPQFGRETAPVRQVASAAGPVPVARREPVAPRVTAPATQAAAGGAMIVGQGDTLAKIAHRSRVSVNDLARANNLDVHARLHPGTRLTIPAHTATAAAIPTAPAHEPAKVASVAPAESARMLTPATETPKVEHGAKEKDVTNATPAFRWPVRGRIIAGFGPKPNGAQNDGINLAVPEGTPVKAADDGVVAYSGNELKGYGNLVLIRHPNGYVTAYAHASELLVKRGEAIKRGQVIAKAGQTGNVTSPQLHFEIRKGSTPVDPRQFLNGA